jgi:hypothetical protein
MLNTTPRLISLCGLAYVFPAILCLVIDNEFFSIDSSLHSSSQSLTLASTPCRELMKLVGSLNM